MIGGMSGQTAKSSGRPYLGRIALTFDLDWAPDWCVRECYALCLSAGVKATFFVTNPMPVLADIETCPQFELGLHPNFLPGSTQLADFSQSLTYASVLKYLTDFLPAARSLRTHSLYNCSSLYAEIEENWPSLLNDVSLFTFFQFLFEPIYMWHSDIGRPLVRLPYQFEDDVACRTSDFDYEAFLGLCARKRSEAQSLIFDFHPIHVALNSRTLANYRALKSEVLMPSATPDDVRKHQERGRAGTRAFLERLLSSAAEFHTISELGESFRLVRPWPMEK
jgi:hypothetical protein